MEFPYKLKLNMRALVKFEDATGQNLFSALGVDERQIAAAAVKDMDRVMRTGEKISEEEQAEQAEEQVQVFDLSKLRFSVIAAIVWAGRLHEKPDLTQDQNLDDLADLDPMEVFNAAAEAISNSMNTDADQGKNPKAPGQGQAKA